MRALGTITFAADAFVLGWLIGTGVNAKFLQIGYPETPDPDTYFLGYSARWMLAGEPVTHAGVAPVNAFYLQSSTSGGSSLTGYLRGNPALHGACQLDYDPGPMSDWTDVTTGQASCRQGSELPRGYREVHAYYNYEDNFPAIAPVQDYVGQPYDRTTPSWANQPTTATQLEDRVRVGLDTHEIAENFYAELLEPQDYDQALNKDEDCDLGSGGTGVDPAPERGTSDSGPEFLARYEQVPAIEAPTLGFPTVNGPAFLRWGYTTPASNSQSDFSGWGYRKIKAKHGWSADDREATRVALMDPTPTPDRFPGRFVYLGPEYSGLHGAICQRLVVVEHQPTPEDEGAPSSAGIISSYRKVMNR